MTTIETDSSMERDGKQAAMPNASNGEAINIDPIALNKLCRGFLELYVDDLKSLTRPLEEVDRNQDVLIETVQQENARFVDARQTYSLEEMFHKMTYYQSKLITIKKDMATLHDRTVKLKKRTLKLQALKERENARKDSHQ